MHAKINVMAILFIFTPEQTVTIYAYIFRCSLCNFHPSAVAVREQERLCLFAQMAH